MKILEKIKSWFDLKTFLRIIFGILFITAIVLIAYFVMKETGFLEKINSIEKIKEFEYQGIGQLDEEIPLPEEQEPTPSWLQKIRLSAKNWQADFGYGYDSVSRKAR